MLNVKTRSYWSQSFDWQSRLALFFPMLMFFYLA